MTIRYNKALGLYLPDMHRPRNYGYGDAGASTSRRATRGFRSISGSPRQDIDQHNATLRTRGRMLQMSAPIATSAINTNRTNVVGIGLQLKSQINRDILGMTQEQADEWEKRTEWEFQLWAGDKHACDATGINDLDGMQQLAMVSWLASGDVMGVFKYVERNTMNPYGLRIHLIEADRCATPSTSTQPNRGATTTGRDPGTCNLIHDGVEVDSNGCIVAYHFRNSHPQERAVTTDWVRIPAYGEKTGLPNVIHVMNSERPDQYRGISYLAPVIEQLLQLRRYSESELMAAVIESFFTAFVMTETPQGENPYNIAVNPAMGSVTDDPREYEMAPGQINYMKPNEKIVFADPKRPTSGFASFMRAIAVQVGAALEEPADLLLKEFNSSYSASRAALLEAWKAFRMRREWFVADFCRPAYAVWMAEAVALGRIHAPGFFTSPQMRAAYLGSEWIGPSQGQLDPVKEITAEILACSEGFSTREQSTVKLNGGQWDANMEKLAVENEKLARASGSESPCNSAVLARNVRNIVLQAIADAIREGDRDDHQR